MMDSQKMKVVFDTDVGIDDLAALEMLARSDRVQLLCVTATHGNVDLKEALRTLELFVRPGVPIVAGASRPLVKSSEVHRWAGHGADGCGGNRERLEKLAVPKPVEQEEEKDYCNRQATASHELIRLSGVDIVCVCVGPLTNLATAVILCPTIAFSRVIIMGGTVHGKGNVGFGCEFNFHADPEAAAVVLRHFGSRCTLVPWECTLDAPLPWELCDSSPVLDLICARYRSMAEEKELVLCDLVAVAVALDDSLVTREHRLTPKVCNRSFEFDSSLNSSS